jgi:lipopolysaccharide transport system permease protein
LSFLVEPWALLWRHRRLLWQTTLSDIRGRFAGSVLGLLWIVLLPVLLLAVYAAVYIYVFKVRYGLFESNEYVLLIFCGLIPFIGFSEALAVGTPSVAANASLVRNTLFPIDLVPVKAVLTSQAIQVVGTVLLLGGIGFAGKLGPTALLLPVIWVLQILFTIGVIWFFSSINVYARDLAQIVGVLNLILMMVSPIAYSADMVPEALRPFLAMNPLYYVITAYQDALMLGRIPRLLPALTALSLGTFFAGHWFFGRVKRALADNV